MAAETFNEGTNTYPPSGLAAWDDAMLWSLGRLPQAGDDVTIAESGTYVPPVSIATTDPAYMVASLTATGSVLRFDDGGSLTVSGATAANQLSLSVTGSLDLVGPLSAAGGQIDVGGTYSSASAALTVGTLASTGSLEVRSDPNGAVTLGAVTGSVELTAFGGALSVASFSSATTFYFGGGSLRISPQSAQLANLITYQGGHTTVDLTDIPFQAGETASLEAEPSVGLVYNYSVALQGSNAKPIFQFTNIQQYFSENNENALTVSVESDGSGGTLVTFVPCYANTTAIAVPGGERRACDLQIGDLVLTASGPSRPVKWIGRRRYAGRFLASNPGVQPVRFRSGSLGGGLPRRDLLVSPDHAMFIDGVLIPARCLLNGTTIAQERGLPAIEYIHVELDTHDVLLAEGAPSESFLDDDSRAAFHNAAEFARLYPDASPPAGYCAPRTEQGAHLETVRRHLAEQLTRAA